MISAVDASYKSFLPTVMSCLAYRTNILNAVYHIIVYKPMMENTKNEISKIYLEKHVP